MRGFVVAIGCAILAGCGGGSGGGGGGRAAPVDVVLTSIGAFDGTVTSTGNVVADEFVAVGDQDVDGVSFRGFHRFDLSAIPPGALITCAVFRTYQGFATIGVYVDLGDLSLDWVELGGALDGADYDASAVAADVATVSTGRISGHLEALVTDTVQACLDSNGTHLDLRLRFPLASDGDRGPDYLWLASAEDDLGSGEAPTLLVSYLP